MPRVPSWTPTSPPPRRTTPTGRSKTTPSRPMYDTDPDGNSLSVVAVTPSTQGVTPVNNGDGTITYNPPAGFRGTDTFTYTIRDALGNEAAATVTVAVTPINNSPTLDPVPDSAA